jgi:hypothetical protein
MRAYRKKLSEQESMYEMVGDNMRPDNPYQVKLLIDKKDVYDYKEEKIEEYSKREVKDMLITEILHV